jgi:hypothetical protein
MPRYHNINGVKVQFTAEEEIARDAEEKAWADGQLNRDLESLRQQRNVLLADTDYLALSDNTLADNMKTYRQELKNLTNGLDTVDKVKNVTWPTKP